MPMSKIKRHNIYITHCKSISKFTHQITDNFKQYVHVSFHHSWTEFIFSMLARSLSFTGTNITRRTCTIRLASWCIICWLSIIFLAMTTTVISAAMVVIIIIIVALFVWWFTEHPRLLIDTATCINIKLQHYSLRQLAAPSLIKVL